ncbi:MAG: arcB [Mucilaginibacter sp.]|nr:arcB [Mucilaginibacter sp.]
MEQKYKAVVLIVDDKEANLFALEHLLTNKDRIILLASNGNNALKIALNKSIDLIILDIKMPGIDGFEVAQILRSNKKTQEIPIIFASAERTEHRFMMKGFEEGGIDYFFKPLDPEIVKAKVNVQLKVQLQKRELIDKNSSLQKSELLINNSADIIGIIDASTFKIEEINLAFTTILGYTYEQTRGTAITFFLNNEDRAQFNDLVKQSKECFSFDTRIYCKDGSIKWLQWKVVVKQKKWYVNARDITEIREVERIRNYLATVVKQSNDAIYIHDNEGRIISWNEGAEKIYGYSESEALKMKIWNIIPDYMQMEIEGTVNKILKGKKIELLETKRITKHGTLVDVLFSAAIIKDYGNDNQSIAITERDITEQKIADGQIKQLNKDLQDNVTELIGANKELESFSYSVSHDLRAPLRALNGFSKMFEEDHVELLNDDAKSLLGKIQYNAKKMGVLIDDLLAFSRLGRKEIQKQQINTREIVEHIVRDANNSTSRKAVIKINKLPMAYADYSLIYQVWTNLISNAIKYSEKKELPEVVIGATGTETETTYYVMDNGAGFDMKYADKLFGVFQRLHGTDEFEGTGIGLAIVQRIIAKHGGSIRAEGKVNKGATFYFTLPKILN